MAYLRAYEMPLLIITPLMADIDDMMIRLLMPHKILLSDADIIYYCLFTHYYHACHELAARIATSHCHYASYLFRC